MEPFYDPSDSIKFDFQISAAKKSAAGRVVAASTRNEKHREELEPCY